MDKEVGKNLGCKSIEQIIRGRRALRKGYISVTF